MCIHPILYFSNDQPRARLRVGKGFVFRRRQARKQATVVLSGASFAGVGRPKAVINQRALAYTRKEPCMHADHQKAFKGTGMEGWVARWYTRTRRNDIADFRREAKAVADRLPSGASVLEVAPGPGFFAIELAKLQNCRISGMDISRTLVQIATHNARNAGVKIDFRLGNASAMPFPDKSFDFVYCSAAFK